MFEKAVELIKKFEGYSETSYLCPAKVWTIGYGFTLIPSSLVGEKGNSLSKVKKGQKIASKESAIEFMNTLLEDIARDVMSNTEVDLSENQLNALISFVFNLGIGNYKSSTLRKKINKKDFKGAGEEFLKWDKADGKVLAGLSKRRAEEKELFDRG